MPKPIMIAVCGGSGAGKTTLARSIQAHFGQEQASMIEQDWYYRDLSHLPNSVAAKTNFDHPDAIESDLLAGQLRELARGKSIQAPQYQFSNFSRSEETVEVQSRPIIVADGLFILHDPKLRAIFDMSIFVDVPSDIRLARRIRRDISERGYELERILEFWESRARPMFTKFVLPQKKHASIVWKSLKDKAFVTEFLADLESRLPRNGNKPRKGNRRLLDKSSNDDGKS